MALAYLLLLCNSDARALCWQTGREEREGEGGRERKREKEEGGRERLPWFQTIFNFLYWKESFLFSLYLLGRAFSAFCFFLYFSFKLLGKSLFFLTNHFFFLWEIFFSSLFFRGKIFFFISFHSFFSTVKFSFSFFILCLRSSSILNIQLTSHPFSFLNLFYLMKMEESHLLCPGFSSLSLSFETLLSCKGTFSSLGWPYLLFYFPVPLLMSFKWFLPL